MKRNNNFLLVALTLLLAGCCRGSGEDCFVINEGSNIYGLHAPWDGLDDQTSFHCFADEEWFNFSWCVKDSTITLVEPFTGESDVEPEDRVEIFFSSHDDMRLYYCAEIDPSGHILDYSCRYRAQMDYGWNFSTMQTWAGKIPGGYAVSGRVSLEELRSMGIERGKPFYMGVFRADFRADGSVNWYSHVQTDDESPFFHKPDMLFKAIITK